MSALLEAVYRIKLTQSTPGGLIVRFWQAGHWGKKGKVYKLTDLRQALAFHKGSWGRLNGGGSKIDIEKYEVTPAGVIPLDEFGGDK